MRYVCSQCGVECIYDGRCGDGPVLVCDCRNIGYFAYDTFISTAKPVPADLETARKDLSKE